MATSFFSLSIRSRIMLLLVLPLIGIIVTAVFNKYNQSKFESYMVLNQLSNDIRADILQIMLYENQLINTEDKGFLSKIIENQEKLNNTVKLFTTQINQAHLREFIENIKTGIKEHMELFNRISANIEDLANLKKTQMDDIKIFNNQYIGEILKQISIEENELFMTGEQLSGSVKSMQRELNFILVILNKKVMNLQQLFISGNVKEYEDNFKAIDKELSNKIKNAAVIVNSVKKDAFTDLWEKSEKLLEIIKQKEIDIIKCWKLNKEAMPQLLINGDRIKDITYTILEEVNIIIDRLKKMQAIFILVFVLGIIFLVGIFGYFIIMNIITPIKKSIHMLKDIAEGEGDLRNRLIIHAKDEIGELASWFNVFVEKIQTIVKHIVEDASTLRCSSEDLVSLSKQLKDSSEEMSLKSNSVASAAEEMSVNIKSVSSTMAVSTSNINLISASCEELTSTINEIANNSDKANEITSQAVAQTEKTTDKVNQLGNTANKIGKITEVITEISDQTNLLALNATIEAARAGDAGKGFSVVANEIKELAKQTASATLQIKEQISGIQGSTSETVKDIKEISSIINKVNEIVSVIAASVSEQSITTKEIASNVSQVSTGLSQVNKNTANNSDVSSEIAKDIADANKSVEKTLKISFQINERASNLSEFATQLNSLVGSFKI
ncbi:MAG: methyl-accepting chemotaxis protein [Desulfobacterales bacterium]|nr:methyl-accepting chemotaxis protein [Desulfobacterales bacterium]